jgi:hypothetical protein
VGTADLEGDTAEAKPRRAASAQELSPARRAREKRSARKDNGGGNQGKEEETGSVNAVTPTEGQKVPAHSQYIPGLQVGRNLTEYCKSNDANGPPNVQEPVRKETNSIS